ncbi:hypothetical protein FB451DRAFT_1520361 [Mycena latifolia]|nr:hypothetical protein FB451DRAFT_1520361 [Mycena latifolia]
MEGNADRLKQAQALMSRSSSVECSLRTKLAWETIDVHSVWDTSIVDNRIVPIEASTRPRLQLQAGLSRLGSASGDNTCHRVNTAPASASAADARERTSAAERSHRLPQLVPIATERVPKPTHPPAEPKSRAAGGRGCQWLVDRTEPIIFSIPRKLNWRSADVPAHPNQDANPAPSRPLPSVRYISTTLPSLRVNRTTSRHQTPTRTRGCEGASPI